MPSDKKSIVTLQSELDELLMWFESGDIQVEQAVVNYEKAKSIIEQIEAKLKTAENKIEKIKKQTPKG